MLNLTRKCCCSRLPSTSSIPVTDKVGRSNLGAISEHATRHSDQPMNSNGVRGNMSANDTDYPVHGLDSVRWRDRLRGLAAERARARQRACGARSAQSPLGNSDGGRDGVSSV